MKVLYVLQAIEALNLASAALLRGNLSVEDQVKLGTECARASIALSVALERAGLSVPLEKE